jgi:CheY-like chemotaxis protein
VSTLTEKALGAFVRAHDAVYQRTGGLIGHRIPGAPNSLLLHTVGAKTGLPRTNTLSYALDGDTYLVVASNGGEALLLCERRGRDVDLLLTDVVMPGLDGRALAERLAPLCPAAKVLYMSGYTDDVIAHRGVIDAGTHFIAKPFTVDGLTRAVRSALDDR